MHDLIRVSDEVQTALEEERAVVALETTLVAHGFPAPDGVETGLASEAAVRAAGLFSRYSFSTVRSGSASIEPSSSASRRRPASSAPAISRFAPSRERSARQPSAAR